MKEVFERPVAQNCLVDTGTWRKRQLEEYLLLFDNI